MTNKVIKDLAASVRARLLQYSKNTGRSFNEILLYYSIERFLFRLSCSKYRERLILKGGLLIQILQGQHGRTTKDIDLLGRLDNSLENIKTIIRECVTLEVPNDGIVFIADSIRTEEIAKDSEYQGVRVNLNWTLGQIKQTLKLDIGFGDAVVPQPTWIDYPEMLNFGKPRILGYSSESVIAEKFQAMIELDITNSRLKDFFDIWSLSQTQAFDGMILSKAIRTTFERRTTAIPIELPVALTEEFANNPQKQRQWKSFLNQLGLTTQEELSQIISMLGNFLIPVCQALISGRAFDQYWPAAGPWQAKTP
ncbi:MAG: nucleotidyl transferase AbiEii/AbiGii toxin family protein [Acidobacteriota bacterium]